MLTRSEELTWQNSMRTTNSKHTRTSLLPTTLETQDPLQCQRSCCCCITYWEHRTQMQMAIILFPRNVLHKVVSLSPRLVMENLNISFQSPTFFCWYVGMYKSLRIKINKRYIYVHTCVCVCVCKRCCLCNGSQIFLVACQSLCQETKWPFYKLCIRHLDMWTKASSIFVEDFPSSFV